MEAKMSDSFSHGYALLIGVGRTANPKWSLPVTVRDVRAIQAILTNRSLCAYPNDAQHIKLLHDSEATRSAILAGLAWLKAQAQSDSEATIIVYYSGHGGSSNELYYLLPHDTDPKNIHDSALAATEFTQPLREIRAKRLLVMLDCCHAEGMATAKGVKLGRQFKPQAVPKSVADKLKTGEGRAVFSSSRGAQLSWICPDDSLSIYTYHLLEAFQGAGNKPGDREVRLSNLMNHLGATVPTSAQKFYGEEQVPFFDTATEDFPVAVLRGGKGLPAQEWGAIQAETQENIHQVAQTVSLQVVQASGERSVAIGGNAETNTIVTGDQNVIQRGKYNVNIDDARGIAIGDQAQVNYHDDDENELAT
jgi:uncharacterized caspase-like protein